MADSTFNTASGQKIDRELLILYINTGTASTPVWSVIGTRTEDSTLEMDWQRESVKDILGTTRNSMKKPIVTQTFDPAPLDAGYTASVFLWNRAIKDQDANALCEVDTLIVHKYVTAGSSGFFAERYAASSFEITGLGGAGGEYINMPFAVTLGGTRTTGSAAYTDDVPTFTADNSAGGGDDGNNGLT